MLHTVLLGEEERDVLFDFQRLKSDSWFDYVQYVGKNFLFDIRSSKTISITHWVPLY